MFQAAVFFAVLCCVASLNHPDEVKSLPGLNFPLNYRHYSGYLNASNEKFLFYWFVESQRSPSTDPLILWMNGGPGCSSLEGFLNELGPLHISADGKTLFNNTFSWNREANVIFLESPAGVGFSYSLNEDYRTDDDIASHDNYIALQHFFEKFPQFKKNDFYITGESYAGVYVPTLSLRVLNGSAKINLKGFAIGNGLLDDYDLYNSLMFFAYYHGLIGNDLWNRLEKYCCNGTATPSNCKFALTTVFRCFLPVYQVIKTVHASDLNPYNLYADCEHSTVGNSHYLSDKWNLFNVYHTSLKVSKSKNKPTCIDASNLYYYLNQHEVRKALHIPNFVHKWDMCRSDVGNAYKRLYNTVRPQILQLIKSGKIRGLVYNGDVDMASNFLGNEWFCDKLGLKVLDSYHQWKYNNQVAGYAKYYDKLTFVTVKGAGHMVPQDKPGPAFKMISSFLNNKWL